MSHRRPKNSKRTRKAFFSSQHRPSLTRGERLRFETLEQRQLLSVNPIISEFMASNSTTLADYYGKHPDWLEIYNPDAAALNFSGWKLKDNTTVWTIPANVTIPADGLLDDFLRQPRHGSPQRRIAHQLQARRERRLLGTARSPTTPWFRNMRRNIPSNTPTYPTVWFGKSNPPRLSRPARRRKPSCRRPPTAAATLGAHMAGQSGERTFQRQFLANPARPASACPRR